MEKPSNVKSNALVNNAPAQEILSVTSEGSDAVSECTNNAATGLKNAQKYGSKPCIDLLTIIKIAEQTALVKNDLSAKLRSSSITDFSKITAKRIADCGVLKKELLAEHLLKLVSVCSSIPNSSVELGCSPSTKGEVNHFEAAITSCITKQMNDISKYNDSVFDEMKDQIARLEKFSSTLNATINCQPTLARDTPQSAAAGLRTDTYVHESCNSFTSIADDFLDPDLKLKLNTFLNGMDSLAPADENNSRGLRYYGEFDYRYGKTTHKSCPIPDPIKEVIEELKKMFPKSCVPNTCLITHYENGNQFIPPHADDEPFIGPESDIFTLSLGARREMQFTNVRGDREAETLPLPDNSVVCFSRYSQADWRHSILQDAEVTGHRFSLTFRNLAPYNIHATAIYGDSNTEGLSFGNSPRSFGKWMPGKRVKASRIRHIPTPDKIGPYRNVVLSVGINDINDMNSKPMSELMKLYESKCKDILSVYPKVRIHVSLILPTKDLYLNTLANEFNGLLITMASKYDNISVIKHHCLVDGFGYLDETLGRYELNGRPCYDTTRGHPSDDVVHLGPLGYERYMCNIRDCIITKRKKQDNKRVPYYQPDRSSTRRPVPRSTQPQSQSDRRPASRSTQSQPDLRFHSSHPFPSLGNPHPSRSGFSPSPFPTQPSTRPLPSTSRSFNGDYHSAVSKSNYVSLYPRADDRHHY
jgi:alkylated DNA repair dioxygenase AlkB